MKIVVKKGEFVVKRYLVTGASSGIGRAIALHLAKQGGEVVCVGRNKERLEEVCDFDRKHMWYISYDLSNLEDIQQIFDRISEKSCPLDGLVHSAGINNDMPIRTNKVHIMRQVMDVNYGSFVELGKFFSKKRYSSEGGSIVAISSGASVNCKKGMCTYRSSKAALNAAVQVMAREFIKRKIRVNAILPGFVDTDMAQTSLDYNGGIMEQQPLGIIEPKYIAYLTEFLLSDKAKYMTGSLIPMTGGTSDKERLV